MLALPSRGSRIPLLWRRPAAAVPAGPRLKLAPPTAGRLAVTVKMRRDWARQPKRSQP